MISEGLNILNKRLKQVDKKFKVKIVFYNGESRIVIYYRKLFRNIEFGNFSKTRIQTINPKMLDIKESDYDFIISCIKDFQNDYL